MAQRVFYSLLVVALLFGVSNVNAQKQKVILDTDIGSDIDDAFALALIICSPEFELLGVTTDHGLTDKRAQIACRMLYEAGMENVPVAVGRRTAEVVKSGKKQKLAEFRPQFIWADGFDKKKPIEQPASDFIIEMLRRYPHQIILFTIGPVPNMGDIMNRDSEALKLAKGIYSMFGSFYYGYGMRPAPQVEWNVRGDIESSKKFAASGAKITYAGLDVTADVTLDKDYLVKLLMRQSPLTNALCSLYSLWGLETPVLFDVVAVGMALWPDLFTTRAVNVHVTDEGYTIINESKTPNCYIGMTINKKEFIKRIMKRYLQQNLGREQF